MMPSFDDPLCSLVHMHVLVVLDQLLVDRNFNSDSATFSMAVSAYLSN